MKLTKQNITNENAELIYEAILGNNRAVEKFYNLIFPFIKSSIRKLDFNFRINEIESLSHELFTKIYFKLPQYNPNRSIYSWVFTVIKNSLIDDSRKEKAQRFVPIENKSENPQNDALNQVFDQSSPSPEDLMIRTERTNELNVLLGQLSEKNNVLVIGFYLEGKSLKELSKELNVSANSISIRLLRIKQTLRKIYLNKNKNN